VFDKSCFQPPQLLRAVFREVKLSSGSVPACAALSIRAARAPMTPPHNAAASSLTAGGRQLVAPLDLVQGVKHRSRHALIVVFSLLDTFHDSSMAGNKQNSPILELPRTMNHR